MASKELRPTLGTGVPKTRKRNIQTKLDPDTFRSRVFEVLELHGLSSSSIPALSSEDLDYSRYGEVFCEIMIAGNIVEPGGAVRSNPPPTQYCVFAAGTDSPIDSEGDADADDDKKDADTTEDTTTKDTDTEVKEAETKDTEVKDSEEVKQGDTKDVDASTSNADSVLAVVDVMHQLMRRKPFLRARYDAVLTKLLSCLAVFAAGARDNLAVAIAAMLERQMLSPNVLKSMSNATVIATGVALQFMTSIITAFLEQNGQSVDKLMALLKSAGIDTGTMVNMMPTGSRSAAALSQHFRALGLLKLVEQNERRVKAEKMSVLKEGIAERLNNKPTATTGPVADLAVEELTEFVRTTRIDNGLTEQESVQAAWSGVVNSVNLSRKTQQNRIALLTATKSGAGLLRRLCASGSMQIELILQIQSYVSADMELLKNSVFCDVINLLYHEDVLSEQAVLRWFRRSMRLEKGSAASSDIIRDQMVPFVKWLETAEEESDEEEEQAKAKTDAAASKADANEGDKKVESPAPNGEVKQDA